MYIHLYLYRYSLRSVQPCTFRRSNLVRRFLKTYVLKLCWFQAYVGMHVLVQNSVCCLAAVCASPMMIYVLKVRHSNSCYIQYCKLYSTRLYICMPMVIITYQLKKVLNFISLRPLSIFQHDFSSTIKNLLI
jgi:hypothetical protein